MDWPIFLQIVTLLVASLTTAFTSWMAYKQAELRLRVEDINAKAEVLTVKGDKREKKLEEISYTIDGHLKKLVESQLSVGRLEGIEGEQARVKEQQRALLVDTADAARTLRIDAKLTAEGVIFDADKAAEKRITLAQEVARELAVKKKPAPSPQDTHAELTDAAHVAVQDLSDESKPEQ